MSVCLLGFVFSFCFVLVQVFQKKVSLCNSPGYPRIHSVDQANLKLKRSTCLCLLSVGIKGGCHHCPCEHVYMGYLKKKKVYFIIIFCVMGVLPKCMSVNHIYSVPKEVRKDHQLSWNWSLKKVVSCPGNSTQMLWKSSVLN